MSRPIPGTRDLHTFALKLCDTLMPSSPDGLFPPTSPFLTLESFRRLLAHHGLLIGRRKLYSWTSLTREHLPASVQTILSHAPSMWYLTLDGPVGGGHRGRSKIIPLLFLQQPSQLLASASKLTTTLEANVPIKHQAIVHILTRQPHSTAQHISRQLTSEGLRVTRQYVNQVKRIHFAKGHPSCKPS